MATKRSGARNLRGEESEQSKERRKKQGRLSDEETVQHIRSNPMGTNRMPTQGTDFAKQVKDFFDPAKKPIPEHLKTPKSKADKRGK